MSFKELGNKPDFPKIEKEISQFWQRNEIITKYLKKNEKSSKRFSFLDGPITANNPMGVHHAWGRTLKDLYQRYKNMQGFKERFQNGFDNQGLWVEVEVEKKLNFKSKKDIENYGIASFIEKCKEHTLHFAAVQTEQSKRLGYFMDWDNSYYTLSDENNFSIWHFLKTCHEKGWLYKGEDVVTWCPRCGTAISEHETLTGDYTELTHKAVFVKYPLAENKDEFLLVWTTTPWTLPANVAVAVNPEADYLKIKTASNQVLILAKNRLEKVINEDYETLEEAKGEKLVGLKYLGLYDSLPIVKKSLKEHLIVSWKEGVVEEEGTGLVHISTGSGPEDYDLGKEIGLPVFPVIDEAGVYLEGYGPLAGKKAQEIAETIIANLQENKFLYRQEDFKHRYPSCWRCKTALLFRLVDEWYIRMDELREKMMKVTKKINWIPEFGRTLELDWLKNMDDWLISKKRYWGLALPIWECECGHFEVIGSKEELKEKAIEGFDQFEVHSPHRPWVDKVKIKCPKCGKPISRISDVGNPWLDAGIVPFSTMGYFKDKKYWKEWFPADLVLECFPGQFKNWFYSLIAMATVLEETNPFKNLLGYASVRDEKGREMHKSWGNAIDFNEAADKIGADVMRWLYARQNTRANLNFGYGPTEKIKKQFLFVLWNCYKFFVNYAALEFDSRKKIEEAAKQKSKNALDRWIISRLNRLIRLMTERLDDFDNSPAVLALEDFVVNDLSTWYIRRSRDRVGFSEKSEDKIICYATFFQVLDILTRLMAPVAPFLSERLWQHLGGEESIHLQDWPEVSERLIEEKLEKKMDLVRRLASLGHSARRELKIKTRQPLNALRLEGLSQELEDEKDLLALLEKELNVKKVEFLSEIKEKDGWAIKEENGLKLALDIVIDQALEEEWIAREIVRQIQEMRKEASYQPIHRILVGAWGEDVFREILQKKADFILKETIAKDLVFEREGNFDLEKEVEIGGKKLCLAIKKI